MLTTTGNMHYHQGQLILATYGSNENRLANAFSFRYIELRLV